MGYTWITEDGICREPNWMLVDFYYGWGTWRRSYYRYQQNKPIDEGLRESQRMYARRRRARKYEAEGSFTETEWINLCNQCGNMCLCCGELGSLTVDHIIPLSRGGSDYISNIQPLCQRCNSKKHTKSTDYRNKLPFRRIRG